MSKQLRAGKTAGDVKVSLKVSFIKPLHAKWIFDLYNTLKVDSEMAINGFRSAGITEALENAKDMVQKMRTLSRKFDCKTCFFCKRMNWRMTHFSFLFKYPFFNYPSLLKTAQSDYGIKNLIIFFKISIIWFLFRRKTNW